MGGKASPGEQVWGTESPPKGLLRSHLGLEILGEGAELSEGGPQPAWPQFLRARGTGRGRSHGRSWKPTEPGKAKDPRAGQQGRPWGKPAAAPNPRAGRSRRWRTSGSAAEKPGGCVSAGRGRSPPALPFARLPPGASPGPSRGAWSSPPGEVLALGQGRAASPGARAASGAQPGQARPPGALWASGFGGPGRDEDWLKRALLAGRPGQGDVFTAAVPGRDGLRPKHGLLQGWT